MQEPLQARIRYKFLSLSSSSLRFFFFNKDLNEGQQPRAREIGKGEREKWKTGCRHIIALSDHMNDRIYYIEKLSLVQGPRVYSVMITN